MQHLFTMKSGVDLFFASKKQESAFERRIVSLKLSSLRQFRRALRFDVQGAGGQQMGASLQIQQRRDPRPLREKVRLCKRPCRSGKAWFGGTEPVIIASLLIILLY